MRKLTTKESRPPNKTGNKYWTIHKKITPQTFDFSLFLYRRKKHFLIYIKNKKADHLRNLVHQTRRKTNNGPYPKRYCHEHLIPVNFSSTDNYLSDVYELIWQLIMNYLKCLI